MSNAREVGRRIWYDPNDGYEYEPDPNPARGTWHQIDAHHGLYRDLDPETGAPLAGSEGRWRPLT
jgi:hypothetical protein